MNWVPHLGAGEPSGPGTTSLFLWLVWGGTKPRRNKCRLPETPIEAVILSEAFLSEVEGPAFPSRASVMNF
jgi:hypothetical protein